MVTLTDGVTVEVAPPPLPSVTTTTVADLIATTGVLPSGVALSVPDVAPAVLNEPASSVLVVPAVGPPGKDGADAGRFEYQMAVAQTTVLVDHQLGYDPVAVQVLVDGQVCSEYSVVYTIPREQVRVAFDISVQALIRLM